MKRLFLMILSCFLSLLLAACAGADVPALTASATTEASSSTPPTFLPTEPPTELTESSTIPETVSDPVIQLSGNVVTRRVLDHWKREEILTVTFLDTVSGAPENAIDISLYENRSVLGWMEEGNLYIAGEGGINPALCASYMFHGCTNLRSISFGTAFHTDEVQDMSWMFTACTSLVDLDISQWDTSAVTDTNRMFLNCIALKTLDLSGWIPEK